MKQITGPRSSENIQHDYHAKNATARHNLFRLYKIKGEKNLREACTEQHCTKSLTAYSSKLTRSSATRKVRHCHSLEEPKKTWWLKITWTLGWDSGAEKEY